jgi:hypothetical protein
MLIIFNIKNEEIGSERREHMRAVYRHANAREANAYSSEYRAKQQPAQEQ